MSAHDLWTRFKGLNLKWKLGLGAAALFLLFSAGGEDDPARPGDLASGDVLAGFQLQGEKPLFHEGGIEVLQVRGAWVEVRFGDDEKSDRWFNFDYMKAYMPKAD